MKNQRGGIQLITFIGVILILTIVLFVLVVYLHISDKNTAETNSVNITQPEVVENPTNEITEEKPIVSEPISKTNTNDFPLTFLQMENNKKNMIYSPLSIKYALKMLEEGANNNTYKQISNVVGDLSLPNYKNVEKKLSLANGIYIRDTYSEYVKKEFINTLINKYDAEVKYDKFDSAANANKWIEEKTFGIIKNMLNDDVVKNPECVMLLINALAIDMEWKSGFKSNDTQGEDFTLEDGKKEIATMMHKKAVDDTSSYYIGDDVTALTMDLEEQEDTTLEFMAIMPNNNNLKEYVQDLKMENIKDIDSKLTVASKDDAGIEISIPKFSYEYDLKLKDDLKKLGITDAFDEFEANFSKMADIEKTKKNVYVADALHKANIDFSEKGIKAAAVTVMAMYEANALMGRPQEVKIDKPFLFLIRDKNTKEVWFTGTVYEPNLWENDKQDYQDKSMY